MATNREVLEMLLPKGGWASYGEKFEDIVFLEAKPISKKDWEAGFAAFDSWKVIQDAESKAKKDSILERLGITAEEAALLLA
jgi:hypothetical protein